MIADYYELNRDQVTYEQFDNKQKKLFKINCTLPPSVKVGGSYKTFSVDHSVFDEYQTYDSSLVSWEIIGIDDTLYDRIVNVDVLKLKINKDYTLIGKLFELQLLYNNQIVDKVQVEVMAL